MAEVREQRHPQYADDRALVNQLLAVQQPTDRNLADLARLYMRYQDFWGARDIQADLNQLCQKWGWTWDTLFDHTRKLHCQIKIYVTPTEQVSKDDWA
jgi:hypothetical protein